MPTWLGAYRKTQPRAAARKPLSVPGTVPRLSQRGGRRERPGGGAAEHRDRRSHHDVLHAVFRLYARMQDAGHSTRGCDLPRLVARSIGLVILPAVLENRWPAGRRTTTKIRSHGRRGKPLLYPAASIPIFRTWCSGNLTRCLLRCPAGISSIQPGYKFTPIISAVEKLARMPGHAFDAMTGDRPLG